MNILITGGAGFIGSNFVRYWLHKYPNDRVIAYDKLTYAGNIENLKEFENNEKFLFVKGDICNRENLIKAIKENKIDVIINFAAESHVDRSISNPESFIQTNVFGVYTILEVLREFPNIRFHHVSTDEVYGTLPYDKTDVKFTEASKYDPKSPYSATKAAGDQLIRAYVNTFKTKATISNCSNNYGPYCFPEKLIPLTITRAINNEEIPVYGLGDQIRDWIFVEDHCLGIDLILKKGKIGETYLLGSNNERQNIEIIKLILKILNKPENLIVHVGDRLGHDKRYAIDYSKAEYELGYKPVGNFENDLQKTVEWYINNESWWKPLKNKADKIAQEYLLKRL